MFYAPAFFCPLSVAVSTCFLLTKVPRFGAITTSRTFMALFFLASKHGAGAFLPGLACGLAADAIARLGNYRDRIKTPSPSSSLLLAQVVPIFLMWIRPKAYVATLLARGNSKNTLTVSWSLQSWTKSFSLFRASSFVP